MTTKHNKRNEPMMRLKSNIAKAASYDDRIFNSEVKQTWPVDLHRLDSGDSGSEFFSSQTNAIGQMTDK
jgi:hypothetical protein